LASVWDGGLNTWNACVRSAPGATLQVAMILHAPLLLQGVVGEHESSSLR